MFQQDHEHLILEPNITNVIAHCESARVQMQLEGVQATPRPHMVPRNSCKSSDLACAVVVMKRFPLDRVPSMVGGDIKKDVIKAQRAALELKYAGLDIRD